MKNTLRKVLAVLLSVALLAGCLGMTAFATQTDELLAGRVPYLPENGGSHFTEETETVERNVTRVYEEGGEIRCEEAVETEMLTHRVPVTKEEQKTLLSVGQLAENAYSFTTFEDLKLLAAVEYPHYTELVYMGNGPLVISEDLALPAYVMLYFDNEDAHLIVNEGVTFETSSHGGEIYVNTLEVKGTFQSKGSVFVGERLEVSGELIMWRDVNLNYGAQIVGAENIKQKYDYCHLTWHAQVYSLEELAALAKEAAASYADYAVTFEATQNVTLQQDLVIPANMVLDLWGEYTFTIAPGATLTVNGYSYIVMPMVVEGTLETNDRLYCYGYVGAIQGVTFTSTGRLVGKGCLVVETYSEDGNHGSYTDIVKGLDPAKIYVEQTVWDDGYGIQWDIHPAEGKTKLSTPTELQWNKATEWGWNQETGESYTYPVDKPGSSLWKCGEIMQGEFEVVFYQLMADGTSNRLGSHWYYVGSETHYEYYSVDGMDNLDPETGDYYFTVQAIGDGVSYINSDIVKSDIWHYVRPEAHMGTCYDLQWNWPKGNWNASANTEDPRYAIEVLYAPVSFEEPYTRYRSYGWNDTWFELDNEDIEVGYYYFRVRVMSDDITKAANGPWSALSPVFKVTHVSDQVSVDLDSILGNTESMTEEEIRQSVQELDTEELRKSMEADKGASGVIDALVELEAAVGGPAAVSVSEEAAAFDASKVSIVGANLNNVAEEETPVTLVIDKPQKEHVVDTMYDNAVAVSFSMTLDNVEDTKNLAVPVMITLPVPANINPDFLVVLHYAQDGSVAERILPHIFREGAQWYASFTLTSFSDFIMTQVEVNRPTVDMFRMYDPNSGEHFYTGSVEERENLVAAGWNYEGVGFTFPLTTGDPVHRLYDPITGEHLYTMDENEKATLMAQGWNYEGIAFNSAYDVEVPQYRLHNPNATRGAYHFTASQKEADYLMSLGWEYQGIGWYSCGVVPE